MTKSILIALALLTWTAPACDDGDDVAACTRLSDKAIDSIVKTCATENNTTCQWCVCANQDQIMNQAGNGCDPRPDADGCSAAENSEADACFAEKSCSEIAANSGPLGYAFNCPAPTP